MTKNFTIVCVFFLAALAEIAGCFSFWAWLKLDKSVLWLIPGMASLAIFGFSLTLVEAEYAGRAYAGYGAIYILSALLWMWWFEGNMPDKFDFIGTAICLMGSAVILLGRGVKF